MTSEVIPDRATEAGERFRRRLSGEMMIWLTTVGRDGTPQPNPVGFLWDGGDSLLIYSQHVLRAGSPEIDDYRSSGTPSAATRPWRRSTSASSSLSRRNTPLTARGTSPRSGLGN